MFYSSVNVNIYNDQQQQKKKKEDFAMDNLRPLKKMH